jgi:hypothetical protein
VRSEVRASGSVWCFCKRVELNSEVEFWILGEEEEEEERVKRKGRRTKLRRRKGRIWIFV